MDSQTSGGRERVCVWECYIAKVCVSVYVRACVRLFAAISPLFPHAPAGPPVNVAMAIEVASIDHISEANMVMFFLFFI